jgi:hypothetical protein
MKTTIKSFLLTTLGVAGIFTAMLYQSCTQEKCQSIVCAYGGVCRDGACLCPTGYEGYQCETMTRDRFKGVWMVTEDGSISNNVAYAVSVENGAAKNEVIIKSFRNSLTQSVVATVKGDTMYIAQQVVNGNTIEGRGFITKDLFYGKNGLMHVNYYIIDGNGNVDNFAWPTYVGGKTSIWNK